MPKKSHTPIPLQFREACYYLGLDYREIVSVKRIKSVPMTFDVHLRSGGREWRGHLEAPPWSLRPPVCHLADLLDHTQDCPVCKGSGKVPKDETEERLVPPGHRVLSDPNEQIDVGDT